MKLLKIVMLCLCLPAAFAVRGQQGTYSVSGRVIDRLSRRPVAYAAVVLAGQERKGASTDSLGRFRIERVEPGIWRLAVSSVGYKSVTTPEYMVSAATPFIEVELEEDAAQLEAVTVRPSPFRATAESPVSLKVIGLREIEKSPGSNRDVSRIVRSYPGVAFSPVGYRNDLIVRGGGPVGERLLHGRDRDSQHQPLRHAGRYGRPGEHRQRRSRARDQFLYGGFSRRPGRGAEFGAGFQAARRQCRKADLQGDVGRFGGGRERQRPHRRTRRPICFRVRQSYLQLLFKMLGLPFLPNYIDGQAKVKTRLSERDELTVLALAGFDNMKLNVDEKGEDAEYLLSYLPRIRQETFTVGASWRHYAGRHVQTVTLSHNYLNNRNLKYLRNDDSSEDNLTLRLRSVEQKTALRAENRSYLGRWTLREGVEVNWSGYTNRTLQRLYTDKSQLSDYNTRLGIVGWGLFAGAEYASADKRFTASAGLRADGCDYSGRMARLWNQPSPRASVSYALAPAWSVSGSAGLYYQLPAYTALGFKRDDRLVNESLDYMRVGIFSAGIDWRLRDRLIVSVEGFYKRYGDVPLSVADGIPLSCKGNDYGVVGNEELVSSAQGRAYGVEAMARWQIPGRVSVVGSVTVFRSEYRNDRSAPWIASAWDNRFVVNVSGTYDLPRHWSVGAKLSAVGGAPYTPYDEEKSSLVEAWNAQGRPYYDYSRYNAGRLDAFAQLDVRIDKVFYFRRCMLGLYIDLQNVAGGKLRQPDVLMSTGEIENPSAPASEQRYRMKRLEQVSGTLLPSLGVTVEF